MECQGAEISTKIRSAIKAKIAELGAYVDQELPDYVMVMVANRKSKQQMIEDLSLFLGKNAETFTEWLHDVLERLHAISSATTKSAVAIPDDVKGDEKSRPGGVVSMKKDGKQEATKKPRSADDRKHRISSKKSTTERSSKPLSSRTDKASTSKFSSKKRKISSGTTDRSEPVKLKRQGHNRNTELLNKVDITMESFVGNSGDGASEMRARMEMRDRERKLREQKQRKASTHRVERDKRNPHHSRKSRDDESYEEVIKVEASGEALNVAVGDDFDEEDLLQAASDGFVPEQRAKLSKQSERKSIMQRLQPPPTNVVRPMQRHDEDVSRNVSRGRPTRSVVAQVLQREETMEEEYDPFYPAIGNVASVVRVTKRRSQDSQEMQPRSSIFLRAIKDATADLKAKRVCNVGERYDIIPPKRRAESTEKIGSCTPREKRGRDSAKSVGTISASEISSQVEAVLREYSDEDEVEDGGVTVYSEEDKIALDGEDLFSSAEDAVAAVRPASGLTLNDGVQDLGEQLVVRTRSTGKPRSNASSQQTVRAVHKKYVGRDTSFEEVDEQQGVVVCETGEQTEEIHVDEANEQLRKIRHIQQLPDGQLILIRSSTRTPVRTTSDIVLSPGKPLVTLRRDRATGQSRLSKEPLQITSEFNSNEKNKIQKMRSGDVIVYQNSESEINDLPASVSLLKSGKAISVTSRTLLDSQLHSVNRLLQSNDQRPAQQVGFVSSKPTSCFSAEESSRRSATKSAAASSEQDKQSIGLHSQIPATSNTMDAGHVKPAVAACTSSSLDRIRQAESLERSHGKQRYVKSDRSQHVLRRDQQESVEEVVIFQQAPGDRVNTAFIGTGSGDAEVEAKVAEAIAAMDPNTDELLIIDESRGIETRFVVTLDGAGGDGRRNIVDHPGGVFADHASLPAAREPSALHQSLVMVSVGSSNLLATVPLVSDASNHRQHRQLEQKQSRRLQQQYVSMPIGTGNHPGLCLQGRAQAVATIMSSLGVLTGGGNTVGNVGSPIGASVTPINIPMDDSEDEEDGFHVSPSAQHSSQVDEPNLRGCVVTGRQIRAAKQISPEAQLEPNSGAVNLAVPASLDKPRDKIMERCRFWPLCKQGEACAYYHPTTPCKTFPNCRFGDKCLFTHPNCKFDANCVNASCPFAHVLRRNSTAGKVGISSKQIGEFRGSSFETNNKSLIPCRFGGSCANRDCSFRHPKLSGVPCKFAAGCTRSDCTFSHPPHSHAVGLSQTRSRLIPTYSAGKFKWNARLHPSLAMDGTDAE